MSAEPVPGNDAIVMTGVEKRYGTTRALDSMSLTVARGEMFGLIGPDGRPSLTPMWFDYEDDKVLVNTASHRPKCAWIRNSPRLTVLLVNPENPYHWMQIKCTVEKEMREWEEGGDYVTRQLDRIWTKYTGNPPPYGLRDPAIDEKRVLFICRIDRIATFGKP